MTGELPRRHPGIRFRRRLVQPRPKGRRLPHDGKSDALRSVEAALREGAFADLVVFDPETVADDATYLEPARYPIGIERVIVNGRPATLDYAETGDRPGRLLRRV